MAMTERQMEEMLRRHEQELRRMRVQLDRFTEKTDRVIVTQGERLEAVAARAGMPPTERT